MKGLAGLSKCEWITYSRLLRVEKVAPLTFEHEPYKSKNRHANHSATSAHYTRLHIECWPINSGKVIMLHASVLLAKTGKNFPYSGFEIFLLVRSLSKHADWLIDWLIRLFIEIQYFHWDWRYDKRGGKYRWRKLRAVDKDDQKMQDCMWACLQNLRKLTHKKFQSKNIIYISVRFSINQLNINIQRISVPVSIRPFLGQAEERWKGLVTGDGS